MEGSLGSVLCGLEAARYGDGRSVDVALSGARATSRACSKKFGTEW